MCFLARWKQGTHEIQRKSALHCNLLVFALGNWRSILTPKRWIKSSKWAHYYTIVTITKQGTIDIIIQVKSHYDRTKTMAPQTHRGLCSSGWTWPCLSMSVDCRPHKCMDAACVRARSSVNITSSLSCSGGWGLPSAPKFCGNWSPLCWLEQRAALLCRSPPAPATAATAHLATKGATGP